MNVISILPIISVSIILILFITIIIFVIILMKKLNKLKAEINSLNKNLCKLNKKK